MFAKALETGVITADEEQKLQHADKLRLAAIHVNDFETL
ncbi:acyl-CoA dehydrogenase [Shewanella putrefaciens]|nr:acyl-CoA dehydrogenase [Shewanella putrefaciens]